MRHFRLIFLMVLLSLQALAATPPNDTVKDIKNENLQKRQEKAKPKPAVKLTVKPTAKPTTKPRPPKMEVKKAAPKTGVVIGTDAKVRALPSLSDVSVISSVDMGTIVEILEKQKQPTSLGGVDNFWYRIRLPNQKEGWIFGSYLTFERNERLELFLNKILAGLYFYRPTLQEDLRYVEATFRKTSFTKLLSKINPRYYNYLAYHLITKRSIAGIGFLIEFMNPKYKEHHQNDANYLYNWTILEKLTPNDFISTHYERYYQNYATWWNKRYGRLKFTGRDQDLVEIFKTIHRNENKKYRE